MEEDIMLGAAETPNTVAEQPEMDDSAIEQYVEQALQSFEDVAALLTNFVDPLLLMPMGIKLAGALFAIALTWQALRVLMTQAPLAQFISETLMIMFMFGFVWWVTASTYGFVPLFVQGFDLIAATIAQAAGVSVLTVEGSGGDQHVTVNITEPLRHIIVMASSIWESSEAPGLRNIREMPAYVGESFMRLLIALLIGVAGISYIAIFMLTQILLTVGYLMAPIMVPFLLIQPLSFIATGWFKFMVTAGLQKVIGITFFAGTIGIVNSVVEMVNSEATKSMGGSFIMFFSAFIIMAVLTILIMQVPAIASALISGMARASLSMPSALTAGAVAGAGMKMVAAAPGAAAAAGRGGARVAGAASGAMGASSRGSSASKQFMQGMSASKGSSTALGGAMNAFHGARGTGQNNRVNEAMSSYKRKSA